jgi:hypothetical protein
MKEIVKVQRLLSSHKDAPEGGWKIGDRVEDQDW